MLKSATPASLQPRSVTIQEKEQRAAKLGQVFWYPVLVARLQQEGFTLNADAYWFGAKGERRAFIAELRECQLILLPHSDKLGFRLERRAAGKEDMALHTCHVEALLATLCLLRDTA